jgi:hypothetical protein
MLCSLHCYGARMHGPWCDLCFPPYRPRPINDHRLDVQEQKCSIWCERENSKKKPPHLRGKYLEPPVFDKIVKIHRFCADSFQCTVIVELNLFNTISDNWIPLSMLTWHYRFTDSCQIYKKDPALRRSTPSF